MTSCHYFHHLPAPGLRERGVTLGCFLPPSSSSSLTAQTQLRDSGLRSGVAGKATRIYRAEGGVSSEPKTGAGGGGGLTGVQAVVAVGILHLRQQGRNPSDFCPCVCVHARTHLGCAGSCRVPPEPRAARPREHHPSAGRRLLTPRPQPSSPVPSHPRAHASGVFPPWHTRGASCLLCSPGARRAGGALGTAGSPLVFRTPYVPEPAPPSPRRRARPRGLP